MWQLMLLNQFHDIIPGSSIKEVYDLSDKQYESVSAFCHKTARQAREHFANKIQCGKGYLVFNPHSYECSDVVAAEGSFAYAPAVPSFGYKAFDSLSFENHAQIGERSVSNRFFDIRLDEQGNIVSLFDKRNGRETVSGPANRFCA